MQPQVLAPKYAMPGLDAQGHPVGGYGGDPSLTMPKPPEQNLTVPEFSEMIAITSIRGNPVSVSMGNPHLPDCPLIGISYGFEALTGFNRQDSVGRNCRFLNQGCQITAAQRRKLRQTTQNRTECIEVLDNRKKSGETFQNLLHLSTLQIGDRSYIFGIQAEYHPGDGEDENSLSVGHQRELQCIIDRLFDTNFVSWAERQLLDFCVNLPEPWSRSLGNMSLPRQGQAASFGPGQEKPGLNDIVVTSKNTFLDVDMAHSERDALARQRSTSCDTKQSGVQNYETKQDFGIQDFGSGPQSNNKGSAGMNMTGITEAEREDGGDPELPSLKLSVNGPLPSAGSTGHPDSCTPCRHFCFSALGCNRGWDCQFCHSEHRSKHQEKRSAWKEQMRERKLRFREAKRAGLVNNPGEDDENALEDDKLAGADLHVPGPGESLNTEPSVVSKPSQKPFHVQPVPVPPPISTSKASSAPRQAPTMVQPRAARVQKPGQAPIMPGPIGAVPGTWPHSGPSEEKAPALSLASMLDADGGAFNPMGAMPPPLQRPPAFLSSNSPEVSSFTESVAMTSIRGNQVSIAIGNPYLPDCPLIGLSDGFEALTGFTHDDAIGKNCRFLNRDCGEQQEEILTKLRYSTKTGQECLVSVRNRKKDGSFFQNLLHLSAIRVGDRSYMVGIQANDILDSGDQISARPDHRKELQLVIDRIFDMHVDRWAEEQLQNFCIRLPHPYCKMLKMFDPDWYTKAKSTFVSYEPQLSTTTNLPVFCKNTFLDVDEAYGVGAGATAAGSAMRRSSSDPNIAQAPPEQLRALIEPIASNNSPGGPPGPVIVLPPDFMGAQATVDAPKLPGTMAPVKVSPMLTPAAAGGMTSPPPSASHPDPEPRSFIYVPCAMLLTVGQAVHWEPVLSNDLGPKCGFSITPDLPRGLSMDAATGIITGVVAEASGPNSNQLMTYTVVCAVGLYRCSRAVQIKVIDLVADFEVEHVSEPSPGEYKVIFKKNAPPSLP